MDREQIKSIFKALKEKIAENEKIMLVGKAKSAVNCQQVRNGCVIRRRKSYA